MISSSPVLQDMGVMRRGASILQRNSFKIVHTYRHKYKMPALVVRMPGFQRDSLAKHTVGVKTHTGFYGCSINSERRALI